MPEFWPIFWTVTYVLGALGLILGGLIVVIAWIWAIIVARR